ncbi:MAG: hypothetical protein WCV99_19675 [Sterolibacterium sp.]|jgi:hypothetical protein
MKMFTNWIRHWREGSVEDRKTSVLAVAETLVALIAYWYFANRWLLLVGAVAAPLLLMRSPSSKKLGRTWLQAYWWPTLQRWQDFRTSKKIILIGLTSLAAGGTTVLLLGELPHSWDLGARSATAGAVGILGAGLVFLSIECDLNFERATAKTFAEIFFGGICSTAAGAWIVMGEYAGLCAGLGALLLAAVGFRARAASGNKGLAGTQRVTLITVFLAIPYMLAVVLRTTAIRVVATLRYLPEGIKAMPENWADISWRMDVYYPASILPEAYEVSGHLTVTGLLEEVRKESTPLGEKAIYAFSILLYWIPANLYRLSLKSTLWAWWPLLFFSEPVFHGMSDDGRENRTRMTSSWATKSILILGAIYILVYLAVRMDVKMVQDLFANLLNTGIRDGVERANNVISVPPLGIIWWGLLFGSVVVFLLFSYSTKINTLYLNDLDTGRVQLLSAENQEEFRRLSVGQEFWRKALMFAIIQVCWWSSLYFFQQKDPEFMRVRIPEWIW